MLTIYRRHTRRCPHRKEGRKYRRCRCPIWVDGTANGKEIRETTGYRNWEKAQEHARDLELGKPVEPEPEGVTVEHAVEHFLADAEARHLSRSTMKKHRTTLAQLQKFATDEGIALMGEFDLPLLRKFRNGWKDGPLTAAKKLERLRAFFRYAEENKWIDQNPAAKIRSPKLTDTPTMPFNREEVTAILAACDRYKDNRGRTGQLNARRLKAFVLLLRYSGLRISDAATLERDRLKGKRLFLYTAKSKVPVYILLPNCVVEALNLAPMSEKYFFWTGDSLLETVTGNWRRSLYRLFELAGVLQGHPHRFRDTFAVELLAEGVPLEQVSVLLGHRSLRVTEKHYAPWVRSRQDQLEASLQRAWQGVDSDWVPETKGTPEVHEEQLTVN